LITISVLLNFKVRLIHCMAQTMMYVHVQCHWSSQTAYCNGAKIVELTPSSSCYDVMLFGQF